MKILKAETLKDPSASTVAPATTGECDQSGGGWFRRHPVARSVATMVVLTAFIVGVWWLFYVQPMPRVAIHMLPEVRFENDKTIVAMPNGNLVGDVGSYTDELTAYLRFDYLKGIQSIAGSGIFMVAREEKSGPQYTLYVRMPNDVLAASHTLGELVITGQISSYELKSPPSFEIERWDTQTRLFDAAYQQPVRERLLLLPRNALTSAVASFILFKVKTDLRVRMRLEPAAGKELSTDDAQNFAADLISVAEFYGIPLDMLLGIGAMENNYLDIRGDLEHAVWKKRAQPGDIVLRRRAGRVLVSNYSIGPWQITRETLRYAHNLFLRDQRTYDELPPRLRPARKLDFEHIGTGVLTTYAGLLLRDLLDYYYGDVKKAEGAYNGGRGKPNLNYSTGVDTVASYARRVVGMAAGRKGNAVLQTRVVVIRNRD